MARGRPLRPERDLPAGGPEWPIAPEDWEARAREVLEPGPFGYIAGGAGSEATMRANLEAFERRRLRPRMLAGNVERDLSVEVLGTRSPVPFLLAPIGVLSIAHPDAELAVARARRVDRRADDPLERGLELARGRRRRARRDARAGSSSTGVNDRELAGSFVDRAGAAGYGAIVVTLDTLILGWRPRDLRLGYLPFLAGRGARAVLQRSGLPRAARRAAGGGRADGVRAGALASSRTSA